MYPLMRSQFPYDKAKQHNKVTLMGAGTILNEVVAAAAILKESYDVTADIWSLTSVNELVRDGQDVDRWNLLHPTETQ
jgi:pyruvate dehydrogenase E1 component